MVAASMYADVWKEIEPEITLLRPQDPVDRCTLFTMQHDGIREALSSREGGATRISLRAYIELRHSADSFFIVIEGTDLRAGRTIRVLNQLYAVERSGERV